MLHRCRVNLNLVVLLPAVVLLINIFKVIKTLRPSLSGGDTEEQILAGARSALELNSNNEAV